MNTITNTQISDCLQQYIDPYLGKDLVSSRCLKNIEINQQHIILDIELGFPHKAYENELSNQLSQLLMPLDGVEQVTLNLSSKIVAHKVQQGIKPISGVKNIIAVASGKGGVGKSTTAINLALSLIDEGGTVGILDADIYGPSIPKMLGLTGRPDSDDGKTLKPMLKHGLQSMSIGFLVEEETPMIWRGPMVSQALNQLFNDTQWDNIDYLIIDLPPGTGDVQLTMAQKIPLSGAVIVSTPQDIALLDARKGLKMFDKLNVPVLGVIENMSTHICSQCGHEERIFGQGGGAKMAEQEKVDLLASLPLDIRIREQADSGCAIVVAQPDSELSNIYRQTARKLAAKLALTAKDYSNKFPNIQINND